MRNYIWDVHNKRKSSNSNGEIPVFLKQNRYKNLLLEDPEDKRAFSLIKNNRTIVRLENLK